MEEITEEQRKRIEANRTAALAKRKAILSLSESDEKPWKLLKCERLLQETAEIHAQRPFMVDNGSDLAGKKPEKFIARLEVCSPDSFSVTPVAVEGFVFPGEDACLEKIIDCLSDVVLSHFTQNTGGGRACVYGLHDYNLVVKSLKNCIGIDCEEIPWGTFKVIEKFSLSTEAGKWMPCRPEHLSEEKVDELLLQLPKSLLKSLLPFQLEGVRFGLRRGGRCLIADEMGLGKTLQAITIASCFMDEGSLIVVCPAILRHSWAEELERWVPSCLPSDIHLVFGYRDNPACLSKLPKVVITSYAMLRRLRDSMLEQEWTTMIVDESHHLHCNKKSSEKEELKAVLELAVKVKHLILLSGTPSLSRPGLLGQTKYDFAKTYCSVKFIQRRNGKMFQDFSKGIRLEELNVLLKQSIMIRRLKVHVLPELPPKRRQIINLVLRRSDINFAMKALGLECCDALTDDNADYIPVSDENRDSDKIEKLSKTLSALGLAKLPGFFEWLSLHPIITEMGDGDTAEANSGSHKMIIFAYHHKVLDAVQEFMCEKGVHFVRIDCTVTGPDRELAIQSFQSSAKVKTALIGIRAGGCGLNLTAADNVVFLELPMTPGDIQQAEDRTHRHGQKRSVNVYIFCAKDTTDEILWQQLNKSLLRVSSTINGKHDAIHEIEVHRVSDFDASITSLPSYTNHASPLLKMSSSNDHLKLNVLDAEETVSRPVQSGDECEPEVEFGHNNSSIASSALRFEVSKHTGRIHLYSCIPKIDPRPRPLFANFRQEEVECFSAAEEKYNSVLHISLFKEGLLAFISEWKKLRSVERRKLINKPLQLPLTLELWYLSESLNHDNGGLLRGGSKRRRTPRDEISHPLPSNGAWRKIQLYGQRSRNKNLLYKQGWSDMDEPLCKLCQNPCRGINSRLPIFFEDLFCCLNCFEEYRSRTCNRFLRQALFEIESGVCTNCQLDCHRLVSHLKPLPIAKRESYVKKVAPNIARRNKLLQKLVQDPTEGNAWHADHIVPVYAGGGECKLENMRTLCVACHADVTSSQSKERRIARKNAKRRLREAMESLLMNDNSDTRFKAFEFNPGDNSSILDHDLLIEVPGSSYSQTNTNAESS